MIRRAIFLKLLLLVAEVVLTGLAVWALVQPPLQSRASVVWLLIGTVVAVLAVFGLFSSRLLTQLRGEARREQTSPEAQLRRLHGLRRALGWQAGLRTLIATLAGAALAAILTQIGPLSTIGMLALTGTVASVVVVVEVWRPVLLGRIVSDLARERLPEEHVARWRRQSLPWDLAWTGLSTGAAGIVAVGVFIYFFIPLPLSLQHMLLAFFPLTLAAVTGLWLIAALRFMRPLQLYLEERERVPLAEQAEPVVAIKAFRAVQILPYTLAGAKTAGFILGSLLLFLEAIYLFGIDRESAFLMMGAVVLSTFAAALYEAFWHRATLRAVLAEIAASHRLDITEVRSPLSLRVKMFFGFGLVLFFACGISIFWSFVQVRNLAVTFVQKQSKLKAEGLVDRLRTQDKIHGPVGPADVTGLLGQLAGAGEEIYWYLPPSGAPERFTGPDQPSPPLPFVARTRMRRQDSGVMRLGDLGLAGAFMRIQIGNRDLGSVAVLYPDQRRQSTAPGPRTAVLALFFLVLFALCTGIVALIAADLSAPLRALERRAGEMARGDLKRPVVTGAEADEVGRLAFAMDGMRRSLEEQIRTVEELNVGLEEKVAQRTSALARANADLTEALDRLTAAQDQLIRSEKLASIGQLVAGVAHELNNPINAVSNCISPLDEALRKLVSDSSTPAEAPDRKALAGDIHGMLRVIRNGTLRIQRIVSALSGYVRTSSEGAEDEPVDIHSLLDETLEIASHLLVEVTVTRDYGELPELHGNSGHLGQVFMNLVANAAQAMAEQPQRQIRVRTRTENGRVEILISDSGPGIPSEHRARIFDPFFSTKDVGQGTGLGLSISHEIVANHGGSLELVESELGGAAFRVSLPVK